LFLSGPKKANSEVSTDLARRKFLIQSCQAAGAALLPQNLFAFPYLSSPRATPSDFHYHPRYRVQTPLDATLLKVKTGTDQFVTEKYVDQIDVVLQRWSAAMRQSPVDFRAIERALASDFSGASPAAAETKTVRSGSIEVQRRTFSAELNRNSHSFIEEFKSTLRELTNLFTADFQITRIDLQPEEKLETQILYELVGTGQ